MIISVIAEPRSGSTNLINWFYHNKNFKIMFLPSDPKSKWYTDKKPNEYIYYTEHLLIKEDYYHNKSYQELLDVSDKIILLYRENETEQTESWINAKLTNNWDRQWKPSSITDDEEIHFFKNLKQKFKEDFLDKKYFKISYEDLYYRNKFKVLLDYLGIDGLTIHNFPYGKKYRLDDNRAKSII